MKDKAEELTSYIQERCLWQFHSRAWDREENINGVLKKTTEILTGEQVVLETPADRNFYADAKILADQFTTTFPWLSEFDNAQKQAVLESVKERLLDIAVTNSRNGELRYSLY